MLLLDLFYIGFLDKLNKKSPGAPTLSSGNIIQI